MRWCVDALMLLMLLLNKCTDAADIMILLINWSCWSADPADVLLLLMHWSCRCTNHVTTGYSLKKETFYFLHGDGFRFVFLTDVLNGKQWGAAGTEVCEQKSRHRWNVVKLAAKSSTVKRGTNWRTLGTDSEAAWRWVCEDVRCNIGKCETHEINGGRLSWHSRNLKDRLFKITQNCHDFQFRLWSLFDVLCMNLEIRSHKRCQMRRAFKGC